MLKFLPRRLLQLLPTLFLVSVLIFGLQQLLPGDPALVMAGEERDPAVIEQIRRQYRLDQPLPVQYVYWIRGVLTGDLGESDYVEAARAIGNPPVRIALRHVLPNILPPVVVQATLAIAAAIIAEASLSFLGLGQQPPSPSWGSMLNTAQRFLTQAPWMAVFPGIAIFLTVLAFNLLGDGLRDALDPRSG